MRERLLEARRRMMAGIAVTDSDREAMEAFARAEDERIPHSPLTRRVGTCAWVLWVIGAAGSLARELDTYGDVGQVVSLVAYPIALCGWVAFFLLGARDRRAWNDRRG